MGKQRFTRAMAAGMLAAVLAAPALANPVPACLVFTHVHELEQDDFCQGLPVSTCDEITQVTSQTGIIAFDFILHSSVGLEGVYQENANVSFTIEWPGGWYFMGAYACGSGNVDVTVQGNTATFTIQSLVGAPTAGDMLGLARMGFGVWNDGVLECTDQQGFGWWPFWNGARAGTECGTCLNFDCDYRWPINPVLQPPYLHLVADETLHPSGQFHVAHEGSSEYPPVGEYEFVATEPWLSVDTVYLGSDPCCPIYDATVYADATGLAPGVYDGWIEVRALDCQQCERVVLTVPETQAVPDEGQAEPETWGSIKARFR